MHLGCILILSLPSVQHKTKCLVCTAKGINPLSGELQLASDLDFYIDGVSVLCCHTIRLLYRVSI